MPNSPDDSGRPFSVSPLDSAEWYAARDATSALRDVLTAAGMQREFPYLRADMNAFGQGYVELGRISPESARRIAALILLGLAITQRTPADRAGENGELT